MKAQEEADAKQLVSDELEGVYARYRNPLFTRDSPTSCEDLNAEYTKVKKRSQNFILLSHLRWPLTLALPTASAFS